MQKTTSIILLFSLFSSLSAHALSLTELTSSNTQIDRNQVREFFYRDRKEDVLVPVRLLGAVGQPGLYHLPLDSSLTTLLSLAGGLSPDAKLDEINITRSLSGNDKKLEMKSQVKKINFEESLKLNELYSLQSGDVVYIPFDKPMISNNTVAVVTIVGAVLGIVVSGLVIRNQTK